MSSKRCIASDIGGVILHGAIGSVDCTADHDGAASFMPGSIDGLSNLASQYSLYLLSYCGLATENKTRESLRIAGVPSFLPEERWLFTRKREDKVKLMKERGIELLLDDREDIVAHVHGNGRRAVLFNPKEMVKEGGGWEAVPGDIEAALQEPEPEDKGEEWHEMTKTVKKAALQAPEQPGDKGEDKTKKALRVKALKAAPEAAAGGGVPAPSRRFHSVAFLGTGSGLPTPSRSASATVLCFSNGEQWLFDCGEGTQVQFGRASKSSLLLRASGCAPSAVAESVNMNKVERIFITHLHGDHCFGLPGLLLTRASTWACANGEGRGSGDNAADEDVDDNATTTDKDVGQAATSLPPPPPSAAPTFGRFSATSEFLEITGPVGLASLLRVCLTASDAFIGFKYRVTELLGATADDDPVYPVLHVSEAPPLFLRPDADGATTISDSVCAARIDHRVTCYGFSVSESTKFGSLDIVKASSLGVKGSDLGKLKSGHDVTLPNGSVVRGADCTMPSTPGRVFIHLGDCLDNSLSARALRGSGPCPLLSRSRSSNRSVALVVHEATFCDEHEKHAVPKGHCTARHAAAYAAEARAERLVLTHLSQRYLPRSSGEEAGRVIDKLEEEARDELRKRQATFLPNGELPTFATVVRSVEDFEAVSLQGL